jgi:hypothetical protein
MKVTAKLNKKLPQISGNGKNGTWVKNELIFETTGTYAKKICISVWGDKINVTELNEGDTYSIDFDLESKEYNSRWFTDLKAWKIETISVNNSLSPPNNENQNGIIDDIDILPF